MAYSTVSQIRTATGFSDSSKISDTTITSYIKRADAMIDSKVSDSYALPLAKSGTAATPPLIEELSIVIASAMLYMNEYGEESQGADKGWKNKLDWALDILEQISQLEVKLLDENGVEFDRTTRLQPSFYPNTADSKTGKDAEKYFSMRQDF